MVFYPNPNLGRDLLLDESGDLAIANGDLAVTPSGRTCLLQDVAHALDTMAGDLFGHPTYGAGVGRLLGEEGPATRQAFVRAVKDALVYEPGVAARIVPESVAVTIISATDREVQVRTEFDAIDGDAIVPMNLVHRFGLDSPGAAVEVV
jgi:hypothetical protein